MKKIRSIYALLIISMILGLTAACGPEGGNKPVEGDLAVPKITLEDLMKEMGDHCIHIDLSKPEDAKAGESAIGTPNCAKETYPVDHNDDGLPDGVRTKFFISEIGATVDELNVRVASTLKVKFCGPNELELSSASIDGDRHILEIGKNQTVDRVMPEQEAEKLCVSYKDGRRK